MSLLPIMLRAMRPSTMLEHHLRMMRQMEAVMTSAYPFRPSFEIEWKEPWSENRVANNEPFTVKLDLKHFAPKEITVKTVDDSVIVEGKHEEKSDEKGHIMRHFVKTFDLPEGCEAEDVVSSLSKDGILTITAPNKAKLMDSGEREVPINVEEKSNEKLNK